MRHIFGLTPILEPEVDINAPDKSGGEDLLKTGLLHGLGALGDRKVALKVTIPTVDGFSSDRSDIPTSPESSPCPSATAGTRRTRVWPGIPDSSRASAGHCWRGSLPSRPTRSS